MSSMPAVTPYPQLILFGDSITEFSALSPSPFSFFSALHWQYSRRLDVINRGLSGFNTAHATYALPRFFPAAPSTPASPRVKLLIVFFGANDACPPGNPSGQHVPIEQYAANLTGIITHPVVLAHDPAIIVVTPPPVDERLLVEHGLGERARVASVTATYAQAAREVVASAVARQLQTERTAAAQTKPRIACCDLWTAFMQEAMKGLSTPEAGQDELLPGDSRAPVNDRLQALLADGLHLTPDAYRLWLAELLKTIELNFYPELDPAQMEMVFPHWSQMPRA